MSESSKLRATKFIYRIFVDLLLRSLYSLCVGRTPLQCDAGGACNCCWKLDTVLRVKRLGNMSRVFHSQARNQHQRRDSSWYSSLQTCGSVLARQHLLMSKWVSIQSWIWIVNRIFTLIYSSSGAADQFNIRVVYEQLLIPARQRQPRASVHAICSAAGRGAICRPATA